MGLIKIPSGYLPHLHNIIISVLPNKMVAKRHGFLVRGATSISRIQRHTHVIHKYLCKVRDLYPH